MFKNKAKQLLIPVKGLDLSGPSTLIDERASPDCQNVRISYTEIMKREGQTAMGTATSGAIMGLYEFARNNIKRFVRVTTRRVEQWRQGTLGWTDYTGTALTGEEDNLVSFAIGKISGKDELLFTNGVDNIRKFNGTGNSDDLGGTPPIAKFITTYLYRPILLNVTDTGVDYPQRVQFPNGNDPQDWDGAQAGYYDLADDGEEITGGKELGNLLVVYKENSIYTGYFMTVAGSTALRFDKKESLLGCINYRTIQNIPGNRQIFLSREGLAIFNGNSAEKIVLSIEEYLKNTISARNYPKISSVLVQEFNEYWLFIPTKTNTYCDTIFKYNYSTGTVYKDTCTLIIAVGLRTNMHYVTWGDLALRKWRELTERWKDFRYRLGLADIVVMGDSNSECKRFDREKLNDVAPAAIDAYWCTKDLIIKQSILSRWAWLEFEATGNSVTTSYSVDEGKNYFALATTNLTATMKKYRVPIDVLSEKVRYKFRNNLLNESYTLRSVTAYGYKRESALTY